MRCFTQTVFALLLAGVTNATETSHDPSLRGSERELAKLKMYCKNTAEGTQVDYGCTKAFPLCGRANGGVLEDSTTVGICYRCLNDGSGKDQIDLGCSSSKARCEAFGGKHGFKCLPLVNNIRDSPSPCTETSATGIDSGCTADLPYCGKKNGLPTTTSGFCFKCQNNKADKGTVDYGCSEDFPACDAKPLSFGNKCVAISTKACTNTVTGANKDSGCTSAFPMCAGSDGAHLKNASAKGVCFRCLNNGSGPGQTDIGCIPARPICNAIKGHHGYNCMTRT